MKCYYCNEDASSKINIEGDYCEMFTVYACKKHFDIYLEEAYPNKSKWIDKNNYELTKIKERIKLRNQE